MSRNLSASVLAKLRNIAHEQKSNPQVLQARFALERFLYRLSLSPERERFALKGALLFLVLDDGLRRPTRDLDLLGFGPEDAESLREAIRRICEVQVEDGVIFDLSNLRVEENREDRMYGGLRAQFMAYLDRTRISIRIDVGYGDAVVPRPQSVTYPMMLDEGGFELKAYSLESVVAEKLQAIAALGLINSRLKDYYDLLQIARRSQVDDATLREAISTTFERRETPLPTERLPGLTEAYWSQPERQANWQGFHQKNGLKQELSLREACDVIWEFVRPVLGFEATPATPE